MNVIIIKYGAGNVYSVKTALNRMGIEPSISDKTTDIRKADKVLFPGVGEASSAMQYLQEKNLDQLIPELKQPFLGICLGLQLMCKYSQENDTKGLGIFPAEVKYFDIDKKVPHMGWNNFTEIQGKLFEGINASDYVYFVHSYYATLCNDTCARTRYSLEFSAALQKDNFYATQFHPEKSGKVGEQILKNFIELKK
ncbi:MAG: imidazole glycerol phosphate synthase subunit HisH [Candidatus Marinimicrobia bacterium]|nr:imidazole glycerol phosphate synthase subunit HisH [Candidatus Neomarinimicrobiota bacterium]